MQSETKLRNTGTTLKSHRGDNQLTMSNQDQLVRTLLGLEGVESIEVKAQIKVTHKKKNTGEVTDKFQEIRERLISEEEFESLTEGTEWNHHGTIDVIGDFRLKDKFTKTETVSVRD